MCYLPERNGLKNILIENITLHRKLSKLADLNHMKLNLVHKVIELLGD